MTSAVTSTTSSLSANNASLTVTRNDEISGLFANSVFDIAILDFLVILNT